MKDKFEDLNDTFDVESKIIKKEATQISKDVKSDDFDVTKDYEYTRGNLYSIIEKGQEALDSALELAIDGGQPRAYEVVGQLIKNVADATDKLLDLQKKLKDLDDNNSKRGNTTNVTNNSVFFGSTDELSKFLKKQKGNLEGDK
ncbi:terminase [archaeon]|nr:terminase [archaeon]